MNKYYQPGSDRQTRVNDLFRQIAPRYDLINDLQSAGLHRFWKGQLLRLAAPRPGEKALDLCCGTGDVALALARQGLEVVGLDFSAAMLDIARQRLANAQANSLNLKLIWGDATQTPFEDASFDLVTISYGLRNLPDWKAGLAEMRRLLRPGGRLLVLDFGHPDQPFLRWLYFSYLRVIVPIFGRIFCGDWQTHSYILESLIHYPGQRGVDRQLRAMSCQDVRLINLFGGIMSLNYAKRPHPAD